LARAGRIELRQVHLAARQLPTRTDR
jgi:hypothetical protein